MASRLKADKKMGRTLIQHIKQAMEANSDMDFDEALVHEALDGDGHYPVPCDSDHAKYKGVFGTFGTICQFVGVSDIDPCDLYLMEIVTRLLLAIYWLGFERGKMPEGNDKPSLLH